MGCMIPWVVPLPMPVTTRIIIFLVWDPYKSSFATVTGRAVFQLKSMDWEEHTNVSGKTRFWPIILGQLICFPIESNSRPKRTQTTCWAWNHIQYSNHFGAFCTWNLPQDKNQVLTKVKCHQRWKPSLLSHIIFKFAIASSNRTKCMTHGCSVHSSCGSHVRRCRSRNPWQRRTWTIQVDKRCSDSIPDPWDDCIFTYMNGWFWWVNEGKYTSPMDPMGMEMFTLNIGSLWILQMNQGKPIPTNETAIGRDFWDMSKISWGGVGPKYKKNIGNVCC